MRFAFKHLPVSLCFLAAHVFCAVPAAAQDVLRGEVRLELEPVYGFFIEELPEGTVRGMMEAPLNISEAQKRAMEEAAMLFGAMIYGWSFHYEPGEKARGIAEDLQLTPLGQISPNDPRLEVTDTKVKDTSFYLWSDYRPGEAQKKRLSMWKTGTIRGAQTVGYGPLGFAPLPRSDGLPSGAGNPADEANAEEPWLTAKKTALEDAARAAIRAILRSRERNRPKEAAGYISIAAFPQFWIGKGQWAASAHFLVKTTGIVPFAAR